MFSSLLSLTGKVSSVMDSSYSSLLYWILPFLVFLLILIIVIYIYSTIAMMAIAKKANHPHPALVWIPLVGPLLVTSQIAKMPWWPILLLLGTWIPIAGYAFTLAFLIFSFIWIWKTFEAVNKPGWWVLLSLIPLVGTVIYLILLGVAAWSKDNQTSPQSI